MSPGLTGLYSVCGSNRFCYDGKQIDDDNTPASLKLEDNGSVLFLSESLPRASFLLTHRKNLLTAVIDVIVYRTSFPSISLLVFLSEPLSDIQLNVLQKWLANFPRLGDRHLCYSLTPVYICLHAPMTILLHCSLLVQNLPLLLILSSIPEYIILSHPQSRTARSPTSYSLCMIWHGVGRVGSGIQ